ncbi:transposase [Streptomyces cirratus]
MPGGRAVTARRQQLLTDRAWAAVEALLPAAVRFGHGPRRLFEAMLWKVSTQAPWTDLPAHYGPWHTVAERFRIWSADGTWEARARGRRSHRHRRHCCRHRRRGRRPGRLDHPLAPRLRRGPLSRGPRRHAAPKSGRVRVPSSARVKPGLWAISQGWPSGSVNVPA